jgi:NAD-dependent dihydropyrimidine dehydrogenase PreA subunit
MYPKINREKCINCKICIEICPYEVFHEESGKVAVKRPEDCIECGECIRNCENNAIKLVVG